MGSSAPLNLDEAGLEPDQQVVEGGELAGFELWRALLAQDPQEVDADEARRLGLVQEIAPAGRQLQAALDIAETICRYHAENGGLLSIQIGELEPGYKIKKTQRKINTIRIFTKFVISCYSLI